MSQITTHVLDTAHGVPAAGIDGVGLGQRIIGEVQCGVKAF